MTTTRAITLLLLSFAFNKALCGPVPQCPAATPPPASSLPPEVYNQNNGQPSILYAYGNGASDLSGAALSPEPAALPLSFGPGPVVIPPPSAPLGVAPGPVAIAPPSSPLVLPPAPIALPAPVAPSVPAEPSDLEQAQSLADQLLTDAALTEPQLLAPQSDQPCKVETNTEVIQSPGETFVHQPGEILISQPPTRLVINHAPYIVRPAPIVLNQGGKTITNAYTRKILPGAIQLRPVIVRIVKPIEKKVLIDKPGQPGCNSYVQNPVVPAPCDVALAALPAGSLPALPGAALPGAALPAGALLGALPAPGAPLTLGAATAADQASLASLLSGASLDGLSGLDLSQATPIELQTADGQTAILSNNALASASTGCGCA